ncbi:sugar phosphate isomerase/epimerase family protein [Paenibacillus sp.]|uniref:sugar phosphate isomerase/epimerase family protein n=1 Tax=Paenibacillus sp. TaxID=58172 RepID=UPI002D657DEB|nr:sugar phosphate isomerase/epimerase family protein [Paenibacillus sp.]HZG84657.1 sugar phosphate isomerase/epimerase family protein [Paenibacillus sp.]
MKIGLTRAGLGNIGTDERFIELAGAYGFEAVDVDPLGLIERGGADGARALLEKSGVSIGAMGLPVEWRTTDEAFRAGLAKLQAAAEAGAQLGCTACCTYILPSTDLPAAHFMAQAIRRLRLCAQLLGAYGIRLGLEYVGPHHLRTRWANPYIWTQEETLELIEAIGEPNVGLLLDSYHWYTTGLAADDIAALQPHQIVHVHLNDARDVPVSEALDNDRVYPGEGVIDLPAFLRAVHATGYRGAVSQEVLTPSAPTDPAEALLQRTKAGFDRVFAAAGLR